MSNIGSPTARSLPRELCLACCHLIPNLLRWNFDAFTVHRTQPPRNPDTGFLRACAQSLRAWGVNSPGEVGQEGQDSPMKISDNFIHFYPLKKPKFQPLHHAPLSRWPPLEHSRTKMSGLDVEPLYSTLCPSFTSTHSTSKFHFNMFRKSVEGEVMLDAVTYGKDCSYFSQLCM